MISICEDILVKFEGNWCPMIILQRTVIVVELLIVKPSLEALAFIFVSPGFKYVFL